jgi:hypothetical protein
MKQLFATLLVLTALVLQGCASTKADLGAFKPAASLVDAQCSIEDVAQRYMSLSDERQDSLDNSYNGNFLLATVAAGSAISSLHASAVKGIAFLSGSSAVFSDRSPHRGRAEALLAGANTLQCMVQKTHEAGYGLPSGSRCAVRKAGKATIDVNVPPVTPLKMVDTDIANRVLVYATPRTTAFRALTGLESQNALSSLEASAKALASKVANEINPAASDVAVAAALNDGAEFVERQVRQKFLDNSKFDYKKIFADLKTLAELSTKKDDAAEAAAAQGALPSGSGKTARLAAKEDPRRTVLKDIVACREKLL